MVQRLSPKHLSAQFDSDLNALSAQVTSMGKLVESQIHEATLALTRFDTEAAKKAIELETQINAMEIAIDQELSSTIARRQPIALDLRLLMGISKATANLERVGDEAGKIARMVMRIMDNPAARNLPVSDLRVAVELAAGLLRKAVDAFAKLNVETALFILKEDDQIDQEFRGFVRQLVTYMMEDPRTISISLNLLFIAKAIERIGDHAKNIAELIIYIAKGTDVRHTSMTHIESACAQ
jgi:phosphate transport system protein